MLPEVNSTTLNPWIQPYSYATPRSTAKRTTTIEGVLSQPEFVTTISPITKTTFTPITSSYEKPTQDKKKENLWGDVDIPKYTYEYNKENLKQEELLYPPERFRIVEENLHYETKVMLQYITINLNGFIIIISKHEN